MKKFIALSLIFIMLFCSCGENIIPPKPEELPYPVNVRGIELLQKPERVVSLSPWLTDVLKELGLSNTLVGVSDFCNSTVTKMGIAEDPNIEAIVKAQPNFVLLSQELSETGREYLSKNNIPYYIIEQPKTFNELIGLFTDLVTIFEGKTTGLLRGQKISADMILTAGKMKDIISKEPQAFLYVQPDGFYLTGDTLLSDILKTIGLTNTLEDFKDYSVSEDELKKLEPTVIFVDKSVDLEEFSQTAPFDKMSDNVVKIDMSVLSLITPSVLENFYDLAGGKDAVFPPAPAETSSVVGGGDHGGGA